MSKKLVGMLCIVIALLLVMPAGDVLSKDTDRKETGDRTELARAIWLGDGPAPDWSQKGFEVVTAYEQSAIVKVSPEELERDHKDFLLRQADIKQKVSLDSMVFDPVEQNGFQHNGDGLYILQFDGPVKGEWVKELQAEGVSFITYLPYNSYLVKTEKTDINTLSADHIRGIAPYDPDMRVHPDVAKKTEGKLLVNILVRPDSPGEDALDQLASSAFYRFKLDRMDVYTAQVQASKVDSLANWGGVAWIEPYHQPQLMDEISTEIIGGVYDGYGAQIHGVGYSGDGIRVSITDTGLDDGENSTMHPDLQGRVKNYFWYGSATDAGDGYGHGTHCAGIVAGDGATGVRDSNDYLYGVGSAPEAELVAQKIFGDGGGFLNPDLDQLAADAENSGCLISSNSWGAGPGYDAQAAAYDGYVHDADIYETGSQALTYVFSAGNSGPSSGTVGSPGTAKNVITVGATENYRPSAGGTAADNIEEVASFSSRGPTTDDRLKPDICAPGTWIASALSSHSSPGWAYGSPDNEYYEYCSGTSMSCPAVSGGAAVFADYYESAYGDNPSPALIKAALVNGATDIAGGPNGGTDPVPNNNEGWGRMNLTHTVISDNAIDYVNGDVNLETGDTYQKSIEVTDSSEPLKISMAYSDAPAAANADPALVNDLNLMVQGPEGNTYYGNAFSGGWTDPSLDSTDSLNNLENVFIQNPTEGSYQVIVSAPYIAEDAVNATSAIDQDFGLTIRGGFVGSAAGNINLHKDAYKPSDTPKVMVSDANLNTDPSSVESVVVNVTSNTEPNGIKIALSEQGVDNSIFSGTIDIELASSNEGDSVLQVSDGDTIQVKYIDNAPYGIRTDSASLDATAPTISSVEVADLSFNSAVLNWTTDEPTDSTVYYREKVSSTLVGSNDDNTGGAMSISEMLDKEFKSSKIAPSVDNDDRKMEKKSLLEQEIGSISMDTLASNGWKKVSKGGLVTQHSIELSGLEPVTDYDFYVESSDKAGNTAKDDNSSNYYEFTTLSPPVLSILVVDDDGGSSYEQNFTEALEMAGYGDNYSIWDYSAKGSPSAEDLRSYTIVIWTTGPFGALSSTDESALAGYLEGGGNLYLSSQHYLSNVGLTSFGENYLKVQNYTNDNGTTTATGVIGDPITDGLGTLNLESPGTYYSWYYSDDLTPNSNGSEIFINDNGNPGAVRTNDSTLPYKTVFTGFPFEAIHTENPSNGSEVMDRIIDWMYTRDTHDLAVSKAKANREWVQPGEHVVWEIWIQNQGTSDENNIPVELYIGGSLVNSTVINSLEAGETKKIVLNATPSKAGEPIFQISTDVVAGETDVSDNTIQKTLPVRVPQGPIDVTVVDSYGTDASSYMLWSWLENNWWRYSNYTINIDTNTLNKDDITYSEIKSSGADVLYIVDAFSPNNDWEFTDKEIRALKQATISGTGIVADSGTLSSDAPNNMGLAPIFGINESVPGTWSDSLDGALHVRDTDHPLFDGIPPNYSTAASGAICSGHDVTNGYLKANGTSTGGENISLVEYKYGHGEAIYFPQITGYEGYANEDDKEIAYNAMHWAYMNSSMPQHEVFPSKVEFDPPWVPPGTTTNVNITVANAGLSTESSVEVNLLADGIEKDSGLISEIPSQDTANIQLTWTPTAVGEYNITVHVTPVTSEAYPRNNYLNTTYKVKQKEGNIKVAILDSYGTDSYSGTTFETIKDQWYEYGNYTLEIDYTSLNHENITYDDILQTQADVLVISAAFDSASGWEFNTQETKAIKQYVREGGGILATDGTFLSTSHVDNKELAPLFGISDAASEGDPCYIQTPYHLWQPSHPVFDKLGSRYDAGSGSLAAGDLTVTDGTTIANATATDMYGFYTYSLLLVENKTQSGQTIYVPSRAELSSTASPEDNQFIYNALLYSYQNTTYSPRIAHEPVTLSLPNTQINITAEIRDADGGISSATLYYQDVGTSSYSSVGMNLFNGTGKQGTWSANIPSQVSTGELYYYIEATDSDGHTVTYPKNAPTNNITTIIDATPPTITHLSPSSIPAGQPYEITADVTDNTRVDTVKLNYTDVDGSNHVVSMMNTGGSTYSGYISPQDHSGTIDYHLWAEDSSGNDAVTTTYSVDVTGYSVDGYVKKGDSPLSTGTVTITNSVTGESDTTLTNDTGYYTYALMNLPSNYSVGDDVTATCTYEGDTVSNSTTVSSQNGSDRLNLSLPADLNNAPNAPINPSPPDGATGIGTSPTLSVYVTDPDGDSMDVTFYNASDDTSIATTTSSSGTTAGITLTGLSLNRTYRWYVKANDGEITACSNTWEFTTSMEAEANDPPAEPSNPSPYDGETDVSTTPSLSVYVSDPNGDTMNVTFYNASDDTEIGSKNVLNNDTISVTWGGLVKDRTYHWYVNVSDGTNITTSPIWSFTTTPPNQAPDKPIDPTPVDGSTGLSSNPTLSVDVLDPDGDTLNVTFYNASDDSEIGNDPGVGSGNTASVTWSGLSFGENYSWYAEVDDGYLTNTSDTWNFTTNALPEEPTGPVPEDGLTVGELIVSLQVNASDPDGDPLNVSFHDASDSSLIGYEKDVTDGDASVTWGDLEMGTTYDWYAVANDSYGETTSSTWSFSTPSNDPPVEPTGPVPSNGSEGVSLSPLLEVTVADPDGNNMTVEFYDASDDTIIDTNYDISNGTTSITWDGLTEGSTYRWYVKADDGYNTTKSAVWHFTTNTAPEEPMDPTPEDDALGVGLSPGLSVNVKDMDGESMDVTFYNATSDAEIGSQQDVANGSTVSVIWSDLSIGTEYSWYVEVTDGMMNTTSATWTFTTIENKAPEASDPVPDDGESGVNWTPSLGVEAIDPDGDNMTVTFYDAEDDSLIGEEADISNGSRVSVSWSSLSPSTTYRWYVEVSDGKRSTRSTTWSFTTSELERSVTISSPGDKEVEKKKTYEFKFTVKNTGDAKDVFDLNVSQSDWSVELEMEQVTVSAGERKDVVVEVTVPDDVSKGDTTDVKVKATSQNDTAVSDSTTMNVKYSPKTASEFPAGVILPVVATIVIFVFFTYYRRRRKDS